MKKKTVIRTFIIGFVLIFVFTSCGGGKVLNSAEALKEYLDKQPANSPEKPIKVSMNVNDLMIDDIASVLTAAGKFVSLDLSRSIGLTTVGNAFQDNKALIRIVLPKGITAIDQRAFADSGLTSIIIPDSVTSIGDGAFSNNSITDVVIPDSVTYLSGFYGNQLTNISIPDSVTTIGTQAFAGNQLTSVIIPDSVKTIQYGAFSDNQITSVNIPNGITSIGSDVFKGNPLNNEFEFNINDDLTISLIEFKGISNDVVIPESIIGLPVTIIGNKLFMGRMNITNVIIPNSVIYIGDEAFRGCTSLSNIEIPNSVEIIRVEAFRDCINLTNIKLNNGIELIGAGAFTDCTSLRSIVIPNSVTLIEGGAFTTNGYGASNLTSVTFERADTQITSRYLSYDGQYYTSHAFFGDLTNKYAAGGIGTYTRQAGRFVWTKHGDSASSSATNFIRTHRTNVNLRLRESANTDAEIITTLSKDTEVQVIERGSTVLIDNISAPWVKVVSSTGFTGWCFSGYLEEN